MTALEKIRVVEKSAVVPFIMLISCFALWGLLNNMTDNLVPAFAKIFMIDAVNSSLVQVAFYGAYAVLAIPAAIIIKRYSYRVGVLVGLGFYIIGALGYIPAAMLQSYEMFLASIFILACGLSVLETTCNPYVLSLGAKQTSIQRLNFAQAFN
ncbi:MAG: MFS transporter, partial [Bacteroidales bacterium]